MRWTEVAELRRWQGVHSQVGGDRRTLPHAATLSQVSGM